MLLAVNMVAHCVRLFGDGKVIVDELKYQSLSYRFL
jgi:hypothetical protein